MVLKIAIFGEAEKGNYGSLYKINSLDALFETFGNPPEDSYGLLLAIQALLYQSQLIFFRVEQEGFSVSDYLKGLKLLKEKEKIHSLHALGIPGVGDEEIIHNASKACKLYKSLLILREKDLYDYLTCC
jgi:hypothetical protein